MILFSGEVGKSISAGAKKGGTLILPGVIVSHWDGIAEDTLSREDVSNHAFQNLSAL